MTAAGNSFLSIIIAYVCGLATYLLITFIIDKVELRRRKQHRGRVTARTEEELSAQELLGGLTDISDRGDGNIISRTEQELWAEEQEKKHGGPFTD